MGFKSRERKRKKKAAQALAQGKARRTGTSSSKWWLTIVRQDMCCARCAGMLRVGREMVYRATPRCALCVDCAERDLSIRWKPSVRWEQERRRARRGS